MSLHAHHLRGKKCNSRCGQCAIMPGQTQVTENGVNKKGADDRRKQHHQVDQPDTEWSCGCSEQLSKVVNEGHGPGEKNTFAIRIVDAVLAPESCIVLDMKKRFIIDQQAVTMRAEIRAAGMEQQLPVKNTNDAQAQYKRKQQSLVAENPFECVHKFHQLISGNA